MCQHRYTGLEYRCSCLSGTNTFSHNSVMVGKYHTDISKVYRPGI